MPDDRGRVNPNEKTGLGCVSCLRAGKTKNILGEVVRLKDIDCLDILEFFFDHGCALLQVGRAGRLLTNFPYQQMGEEG